LFENCAKAGNFKIAGWDSSKLKHIMWW